MPSFAWPIRILSVALTADIAAGGGLAAQVVDGSGVIVSMCLADDTTLSGSGVMSLGCDLPIRAYSALGSFLLMGPLPPDLWVMPGERFRVVLLGAENPIDLVVGFLL